MDKIIGTTILGVRRNNKISIGGDGQVTLGHSVLKSKASKIRKLFEGKVIAGFAGSTADSFTLFEKFEERLKSYKGNLKRAAVEMAKDWRSDKILRRLEAMIVVADKENLLVLTGMGDVLEPDDDVIAIGSGGNYARSAALALLQHTEMKPKQIVEASLKIAAEICVYTNSNFVIEEVK